MVRRDGLFNGMDSIIYDGTPSNVQMLVNTGRANIYGGNVSLEADIGKWISFATYLNYTQGSDLEENVPLRHTTPVFGMTSLYFQVQKMRIEVNSRYNGQRTFDQLPPSEQNKPHLYTEDGSLAWFTLNFRSDYQFSQHLSCNFAVENILNHHYRTYSSGISAPGRNFIVSIKATL
jgi:hemoglobin/transferrin/lactoferrin receptor protein